MQVKAKVTAALVAAGFEARGRWGCPRQSFTDRRRDGSRRFKLVRGEFIFDASQEKQRRLERELRRQFGDQYLGGYFIRTEHSGWQWMTKPEDRDRAKSFCIVIQGD